MTLAALRQRYSLWEGAMEALNRLHDLRDLIRWAERKRLPGPRAAYRFQFVRAALDFSGYRAAYPRLTRWAVFLYRLNRLLNPPRYHKGVAASYRKGGW